MKSIYRNILLNKNILSIEEKTSKGNKISDAEIGSILLSFSSLGFTLSKEAIDTLKNYSKEDVTAFYFESIETLKEAKGANVNHIVFYEEFPNMKDKTLFEYLYNAIYHYITAGTNSYGHMPRNIQKTVKNYFNENIELITLNVFEQKKCEKILIEFINNEFESNKAILNSKHDLLESLFMDYIPFVNPTSIPFKENLALYAKMYKNYSLNLGMNIGSVLSLENLSFVKTPTDLLRIYVAFSDGDITLTKNTKFISLNRAGRKTFLSLLNDMCDNESFIDDLAMHEFLWKKALEKLHIGDYSNNFPLLYSLITKFRNDDYKTYNSKVVSAYKSKNINELISLLTIKPGVFARSIDYLIRNLDEYKNNILSGFAKVATKVSTSLLLQLWSYYKNRHTYETRIFTVNGPFSSFLVEKEDNRKLVDDVTIAVIISIIENSLKEKYSEREKLENVYLSENMKNYAIPTNNRNASYGFKTLTFGSRVKLDSSDMPILRFFTHWKNTQKSNFIKNVQEERVDIDLSLQLYDDNFNRVEVLSWHRMDGGAKFNSFHSGDIITAPDGASEFIDLDYKKAREFGRYALIINNVFTGQNFADIPECFSGVMFRKNAGTSGPIFNPATVKYKYNLTQKDSYQNIALVIDLDTMELIWVDFPNTNRQSYSVAADSRATLSTVSVLKKALQKHMSLYELVKLHSSRITFVNERKKATYTIDDCDDATLKPYDIEKISSMWL